MQTAVKIVAAAVAIGLGAHDLAGREHHAGARFVLDDHLRAQHLGQTLGQNARADVQVIPTGAMALDIALGVGGLCFHPGSAGDGDPDAACDQVGDAIRRALETVPETESGTRVLIENTAGAQYSLGGSFEHCLRICQLNFEFSQIRSTFGFRRGNCFFKLVTLLFSLFISFNSLNSCSVLRCIAL